MHKFKGSQLSVSKSVLWVSQYFADNIERFRNAGTFDIPYYVQLH